MEQIYIWHSSDFDFNNELYQPIRKSKLNNFYNFIFPHENSNEPFNSKTRLKDCKYMIAEVSFPSTWLGIEIGWANLYHIPIIFLYKEGSKISSALKVISSSFIEYKTKEDMIEKLEFFLYVK